MLKKTVLSVMALGLLFSSVAKAENLKAEIADLKAKVASMEAREMAPAAGGDADSLTSLKGNGRIKIKGAVNLDVVVANRDDGDNDGDNDPLVRNRDVSDEIDSTTFYAETAELGFVIQASKNSRLVMTLDFTDFWNEAADQDDLLDECYFAWDNVMGKPVDIVFGKTNLDFGLGKQIGIVDSFQNADGVSHIFAANEEAEGNENVHAAIGSGSMGFAQASDYFQICAQYRYKDLWRLALVLFQNNTPDGNGRLTRGMHEDRSDDNLFFESFAAKFEIKPMNGLLLQASLVNLNNDTAGDGELALAAGNVENANDASSDITATSLGFVWNVQKKLELWGEWQHVWDVAYDSERDEDILSLGAKYALNESIDLGAMVEWANIDWDYQNKPHYEDEDYVQFAINATYKYDSGIFMTLEYAHLWYDADMDRAAGQDDDIDRDVDVLAFRTGFEF